MYLGGSTFACRHYYHLVYQSQRESEYDRMTRKADRIREKLEWKPGILNSRGWKPSGMHWQTFEKLSKKHDKFVQCALMGISEKLNLGDK